MDVLTVIEFDDFFLDFIPNIKNIFVTAQTSVGCKTVISQIFRRDHGMTVGMTFKAARLLSGVAFRVYPQLINQRMTLSTGTFMSAGVANQSQDGGSPRCADEKNKGADNHPKSSSVLGFRHQFLSINPVGPHGA
jgi:hypothetical protein